jgi:hypothetical protein
MAEPALLGDCVSAMKAAVSIPVWRLDPITSGHWRLQSVARNPEMCNRSQRE